MESTEENVVKKVLWILSVEHSSNKTLTFDKSLSLPLGAVKELLIPSLSS